MTRTADIPEIRERIAYLIHAFEGAVARINAGGGTWGDADEARADLAESLRDAGLKAARLGAVVYVLAYSGRKPTIRRVAEGDIFDC